MKSSTGASISRAPKAHGSHDLAKILFLAVSVAGTAAIFTLSPALSTPTLLSIVFSMLLSPWVAALERKGISRASSIGLIFLGFSAIAGGFGLWAAQSAQSQWESFQQMAPQYFNAAIDELRKLEVNLQARYSFLESVHITASILLWGKQTGKWFVENGASMVGSLLTWLLIVPPLTFVMLKDGRDMRRQLFSLVPNRHFESFFLVTTEITAAISDYLRAKLVEAFLVGLMTTIGLLIVKAPYAIVLGILAGVTNILPYVGPIIGAVPALLVAWFDGSGHALMGPVSVVYVVANVIDNVVIFPVVVAKLVNLHPLLLIAVVAIGQQYYGLVGMLISIPIATACKVILTETYQLIYGARSVTPSSDEALPEASGDEARAA